MIAVIGLLILGRGMKTARKASHADRYVRGGQIARKRSGDYFLYRTHSRVRKPRENSSSSSGGSSTFTSSSGKTHGGSSGKF